jgi:hypothetical protein
MKINITLFIMLLLSTLTVGLTMDKTTLNIIFVVFAAILSVSGLIFHIHRYKKGKRY